MLADSRFHRGSNAERLMDPRKVVIHVVERHGVYVVLNLLAERIRQASKPAHTHSHREILALDIAGGNMLRIGRAENDLLFSAHTLRGAVPLVAFGSVGVILHKLGEVDSILEQRIGNGLQVHVVAVRGELHAIRQAPRNILQESSSKPRVSVSNHPRDNQLRLGFNRYEGSRRLRKPAQRPFPVSRSFASRRRSSIFRRSEYA